MDSRKKSKGQKLFSQGVVVLVCLILAGQAVFFGKYLIDSRRSDRSGLRTMQETPQANAQDNARDNDAPAPERPSAQAPPSGSGGQTASGGRTGRPGSTPPDRTRPPVSTAADSRAPYPSGTPDVRNDSIQTDSPSAAYPHDGWHWDRVELNSADSAALDALPGIGPYYASTPTSPSCWTSEAWTPPVSTAWPTAYTSTRPPYTPWTSTQCPWTPWPPTPTSAHTPPKASSASAAPFQKRISPSRPSSTAASSLPPRPAAWRSTSGRQLIRAPQNR